MTTTKVLNAIELNEDVNVLLYQRTIKSDWKTYTRTIFNLIAKLINQKVTEKVIENPYLLNEHILFGELKLEMLFSELKLDNILDLLLVRWKPKGVENKCFTCLFKHSYSRMG